MFSMGTILSAGNRLIKNHKNEKNAVFECENNLITITTTEESKRNDKTKEMSLGEYDRGMT
ncbi:hypothetical protein BPIT_09630 [Candidatus Brocadia pituitae]|nr:hypothetical protein BPIT_09630 [Candidatus Brocadia pituitae]